MRKPLNAGSVCATVAAKFKACLRDERGIAFTEYLMIVSITLALVFYLFHPDNGFYKGARAQYDRTKLLLSYPGP